MFDHSTAVLSTISRNIKKYLNFATILTQVIFIAYYIYLIVVNISRYQFLIAYSLIGLLALVLLVVDISTTIKELNRREKRVKMRTKRIIRALSWIVKLAVIVFNTVLITRGEATEMGKLLLIFSGVFLLLQIIFTVISILFTYYIDLMIYAVKLDYEALIDEEDAKDKPLGKVLNRMTDGIDYEDDIDEYAIKYEVRETVKKELSKEPALKINNETVKKRKAERIILHYYGKARRYYKSKSRLESLIADLEAEHITYLTSDDHLYVLLFFANNHIDKNYRGLSEYATKLIIATLLFIKDGNDRSMVDITFKAISKELFKISRWKEVIKAPSSNREFLKVLDIIAEAKINDKQDKEQTVLEEIGVIAAKEGAKRLPGFVGKLLRSLVGGKK